MKHLHLWENEKFTQSNIEFFNEYFKPEEHFFIIIGKGLGIKLEKSSNILELNNRLIDVCTLTKHFHKYDKIFIHGLFNIGLVALLSLQPWILKKCYWIVWGGDLYSYNSSKTTYLQKFKESMRKFVIKNLGGIITLVKGDYDLAKEWYSVKGKHFEGQYADIKKNQFLKELMMVDRETKEKSKTRIILGNSATKSNNHIEALNLLHKFKDYDIQIICPLSYGDPEYSDIVEKKGRMLFGEKFVPIKKYLNKMQYFNLLNNMDIGIFNNDRQQALGNIISLLYLKKKIYIRMGTTMYEELVNEKGFRVFNIEELNTISYNDFIFMNRRTKHQNHDIAEEFYNPAAIKQKWDTIFNEK